jgi:hypothetical protein
MTNYRDEGVVLTRGMTTLDLRTRAIECPKWEWALGAGAKRGGSRVIPGVRGRQTRVRVADHIRAAMPIVIDSGWNLAGDQVDPGDQLANADVLVDHVMGFLDVDEACTITVHRYGSLADLEGGLVVEDPGPVRWDGGFCRLTVDVTLPGGRLAEASS